MLRLSLILVLLSSIAVADGLPLFDADEPLEITLEFPLMTVIRKAADRPVVDGVARYVDATGNAVSLPVKISTRGKSRLEVCQFPPLSLTVKKKAAQGTVFEGQKSLKLVTHCRSQSLYRAYVAQEFGIYRAFNEITDVSFRVRQLNVTYVDSDKPGRTLEERAFLIESIGDVAARAELQRQKVTKVKAAQLDPLYSALTAVFQFMVGNTDWSALQAPEGSNCCHNGRVLSQPGEESGWKVVPYDFDQTGIINPSYAEPAPQLHIRSVRQRLYRGRCAHSEQLDAVIELFNERRPQLESALLVEGLRNRKSAVNYIASFYRIINDPKQRSNYIESRCVGG